MAPRHPTADPLIVTRLQFKTRTAFSDDRRTHLFVVEAADHAAPRQLTTGEFDNHSLSWGGDGSEIVFLSNREADPDALHNYDIYAVSVSTGAIVGAPSVCVRLMLALPVPAAAAATGWTTASNTDAMVRTTVARGRDLLMPPGMEPLLARPPAARAAFGRS